MLTIDLLRFSSSVSEIKFDYLGLPQLIRLIKSRLIGLPRGMLSLSRLCRRCLWALLLLWLSAVVIPRL